MSVLQVESYDQDLKILLISQESSLADLIAQYFFDQKISVDRSPLTHSDSNHFIESLLEKNEYYKIVVLITSPVAFKKVVAKDNSLLETINRSPSQKIFVMRLSSKIVCNNKLCKEWTDQLQMEDELLNQTYLKSNNTRLIMTVDLVEEDSFLYEPYKTMLQPVPNGYLFDPQIILSPINERVFFTAFSKELLKPDKKHLLITGSKVVSEEFLLITQLGIKELYNRDLKIIDLETTPFRRVEKKENVLEVVVPCELDTIVKNCINNADVSKLGVDPGLLKTIKNNTPALNTQLSKPFKNDGLDFSFETPANSKEELKTRLTPKKSKRIVEKKADKSIKNNTVLDKEQQSGFANEKESINNSVGKIFSNKRTEQKIKRRTFKANIISKIRKKSRNKQIIFAIGAVVLLFGFVVFLSLFTLAVFFNKSQQKVGNNIKLLASTEFQELADLTAIGWQVGLLDSLFELQLIDKNKQLIQLNEQLIETSSLLRALELQSLELYSLLFNNSAQNNSLLQKGDYYQLIKDNEELLTNLSSHLASFQAELESLNSLMFNQTLQIQIDLAKEEVDKNFSKIYILSQLNGALPELLSIDGVSNFYILLQDNQEIRPTGGFPQALARLVIEEGKLVDYQVFPVGWIDSKTLGDVSSSPEVEELLGEPRLHLRDANWDPDLNSSASQVSWFIKEVLNMPFDGLMVINYAQIRELLVVLNELELTDYNETLSPQNLYTRLEAKASEDLQRDLEKNYHSVVLESLLSRIITASDKEAKELMEVLLSSLRNQNTGLVSMDAGVMQTLNQLGWTGSILSPDCPSRFGDSCSTDYLYQVEANVGVNKVNRYINSRVNHSIDIRDGSVFHHRKIIYSNRSYSNSWPMGKYRAYIRFYLNKDVRLEKVEINGGQIQNEQVREYEHHQRKVIGVLIEVPVGDELTLDLHYSSLKNIEKGDSYFFFEQPQPGLTNRLSTISVTHSKELVSELISPMVEVNQNKIVVTSEVGSGFVAIKFADR